MGNQLEYKFSIKRVSKSTDEDYLTALKIYNDTTPNEIRTNTNEITQWLVNRGSDSPFNSYYFCLYMNDVVVGLAMLTYIKRQRFIIIEYIALDQKYRANTVFFSYLSLLKEYIRELNLDVAYYINEISNKGDGTNVDKESKLFKKIVCIEGFGKIEALYITPPLGLDNYESSFEAFLYINTNDNIKSISTKTFIELVHAIYYDYFYVWYGKSLRESELSVYKQQLDKEFEKIEGNLRNKPKLSIKYTECPLLNVENSEKQLSYLPATSKKNKYIVPILIILIIWICPILIIWGYSTVLYKYLNMPITDINALLGGVIGAIITAMATLIISRKKL